MLLLGGKNLVSVVCKSVPSVLCLQCSDAVGWAAGTASSLKNLSGGGAGVVICLERGADLHMAQLMYCDSLSLASVKSRLVLPFWYRLTWVDLDKGPLNGCVCVCVQVIPHNRRRIPAASATF